MCNIRINFFDTFQRDNCPFCFCRFVKIFISVRQFSELLFLPYASYNCSCAHSLPAAAATWSQERSLRLHSLLDRPSQWYRREQLHI